MTAPGAHRRGRHRPSLPPWRPAVALAAFGAVLVLGAVLSGGRAVVPPAPAPTPVAAPVATPVPETVPSMVVYDDDSQRGRERCAAWRSFFVPDAASCVVRPTADGPSPARARAGQDWWTEHYPESEETS